MRGLVSSIAFGSIFFCSNLAYSAGGSEFLRSLNILDTATKHAVMWSASSHLSADVTCDGRPDTVFAGYGKNRVWIGIAPSSKAASSKKPIIFNFGIHTANEDAFCATPVSISREKMDCLGEENSQLANCKPAKTCSAFRVYDGECDSFHFYWDGKHKRLTYWRL